MKRFLLIVTTLLFFLTGYSQCWRVLQSGSSHTVAIRDDGTLWAWGFNINGQLGDGTTTDSYVPKQIGTDTSWKSLAAGTGHTIAIKNDGSLWLWGGMMGNVTTPTRIGTDTNWVQAAGGLETCFAIKADGSLWAWGTNYNNLLGLPSSANTNGNLVETPTRIGNDSDWLFVDAGLYYVSAIKKNGTLYTWGTDADTDIIRTPTKVGQDSDWASVAVGYDHWIGLKTNGTVWAWGNNSDAQFGNGTTTSSKTPVRINAETDWAQIKVGMRNSYFIKKNGTLWSSGLNDTGQMGVGDFEMHTTITQVGKDVNWVTVSAERVQAMGLKNDKSAWVWGENYYGELGLGDIGIRNVTPAQKFPSPVLLSCPCASTQTPDFVLSITTCPGGATPVLATTSPNGISGIWNPPVVDMTKNGSYVFTPDAVKFPCAKPVTATVTIAPPQAPVFDSLPTTVCQGSTVTLPQVSDNNFTGMWNPSAINTTALGKTTYTFTPDAGQCATTNGYNIDITVTPTVTPNFAPIDPVCLNGDVPVLKAVSPNGVTGVWSPQVISNTTSANYTFTPTGTGCFATQTLYIDIIQPIEPNFEDIKLCTAVNTILETTSPNGIEGTWNPQAIDDKKSGQYTFTPLPGQCATPKTITVTVRNEEGNYFTYKVDNIENPTITAVIQNKGNYLFRLDGGEFQTSNVFRSVSSGLHVLEIMDLDNCNYIYLFDNILIINYPKYFTPNKDGSHDYWNIPDLKPYHCTITVFDRYGKLITRFDNSKLGWDGTYNGKPLPATDYWFQADYKKYSESKMLSFKAHFSLVR